MIDIVVLNGGTAAISAALELKKRGLSVLVVSHRTYLGDDICDSLRLALPADLDLSDSLAQRLYGEASGNAALLRPMHLKRELDQVLAEADIPLLLATAAGEILVGANGKLAGITLCNRSGRHVIRCRAVLDGSLRGEIARLARLPLTPPDESFEIIRRVVGGEGSGDWRNEGSLSFIVKNDLQTAPLWAWHSTASLDNGSWRAWMKLEQETRLHAFRRGQEFSADGLSALTGERIHPEFNPESLGGDFSKVTAEAVSALDHRLWFTGPVANVDASTRQHLIRHDGAIAWGRLVGALIVENLSPAEPASELTPVAGNLLEGNAEAFDLAVAEAPTAQLPSPAEGLADVWDVDVLVVGGGTGGAPAAIAAARSGATTLVAEFLSGLGGVGTVGLIGKYWFGNRVGFTAEVDAGAASLTNKANKPDQWDVEAKMQWYHEAITEAGGAIWYKTLVCGALREGNRVTGAILATPQGRIAIRARCVVDATGSAEVAAAAGAKTVAIGHGQLALQGTGLPGRNPGTNYGNTDYDFIDESNAADVTSAHTTAREKFRQAFDAGQLIDSRERRRIVGDYEVTPMDIRLGRIFPDTIVKACSNFDTHGFTVHPLFMIVAPDHDPQTGYIPLRALLPQGLDGILVTGLGISAHRDAMPVIRMQADVQNQGYAAGVIAALSTDGQPRRLGITTIQDQLVGVGILDAEVRGARDSFPLSDTEIDLALAASVDDPDQIDRAFTLDHPELIRRLRAAFTSAETEKARHHFAFVLAILDDPTGAEALAEHVALTFWDEGWNYTGMGQFGTSLSPLDARIIALGRCRRPDLLPALIAKAQDLPTNAAFSHYRALSAAFTAINHADAAPALESILQRPEIRGHHVTTASERLATATDNPNETRFRNAALIELHLAGALFHLSPTNQTARDVLENYRNDLRGLFSRHAATLLAENR